MDDVKVFCPGEIELATKSFVLVICIYMFFIVLILNFK